MGNKLMAEQRATRQDPYQLAKEAAESEGGVHATARPRRKLIVELQMDNITDTYCLEKRPAEMRLTEVKAQVGRTVGIAVEGSWELASFRRSGKGACQRTSPRPPCKGNRFDDRRETTCYPLILYCTLKAKGSSLSHRCWLCHDASHCAVLQGVLYQIGGVLRECHLWNQK